MQRFSYIANAGRARSRGFESRVALAPVRGLTVDAGIAYNDARLVGPQPAQINPALQLQPGYALANVPPWTLNASIAYQRPLRGGYVATARLDGRYRGNLVSVHNPAYTVVKEFALFDLHLALQSSAKWTLGLDVENLFNRFAQLSAKPQDNNFMGSITAARPRTVILRVSARY